MKTGLPFLAGLVVLVAAPNVLAAPIDGSFFNSRLQILDGLDAIRAEPEEPFDLAFDLAAINMAPAPQMSLDQLLIRSFARPGADLRQDRILRFNEPKSDFDFEFLNANLMQTPLPAAAPIMLLGLAGLMTLARRRRSIT